MKQIILVTAFLLLSGCRPAVFDMPISSEIISPSATLIPVAISKPVESSFSAQFAITTLGTKRIFTDRKYHNQSPDVYLSKEDPSRIVVAKRGVTWGDFFSTLPMSLDHDCLVTGTGQQFCTNATQVLRFWLNDVEMDTVLDLPIQPNDVLRIEVVPVR